MRNKLIAAIGALALTLSMVPATAFAYWTNGYEVYVNGNSIGIAETREEVTAVVDAINNELISVYTEHDVINPDIQLRAMYVSSEKLLSSNELYDSIASNSDKMKNAVALAIDGKEYIYLENTESARACLELASSFLGQEGGESSIIELVGFNEKKAPEAKIMTPEDGAEYLTSNNLLTVFTTMITTSDKEYDPGYVDVTDETLYEGVRIKTTHPVMGRTVVTTETGYVNGVAVTEKVSEETVDMGTPGTITIGTKTRPAGVGTGNFILPTTARLTSGFGSRWGRTHYGLDLAASVGTAIYASDYGRVTTAEYKDSFGYLIVIDHGNGYETYYAHNSELLVSVGDVVPQGYQIAKMGSTGRSTGSHCHFEIHYNGVALDPADYVL